MDDPIKLVRSSYIPIPEGSLAFAERVVADLRSGKLTGFALIAVGPETAGQAVGFCGGRMDRMTLLGNLEMMRDTIVQAEREQE